MKGKNLTVTGAVLAGLLLTTVLLVTPQPCSGQETGYPLASNNEHIANALTWLTGQQDPSGGIGGPAGSAWAAMAISTSADPHTFGNGKLVDYLSKCEDDGVITSATDWERQTLAIVACGEDPHTFNGINHVEKILEFYDAEDGQIGDSSLLNDDFWGVISLVGAGVSSDCEVVRNTASYIKNHQNPDGGWGWAVGAGSDVDMTAAAIMALRAAGEPVSSDVIQGALGFLKTQQDNSGGFMSWGTANADSTSWAISAIVACGQDPTSENWKMGTNDPVNFLLRLQQDNGQFYYTESTPGWMQVNTTSYAIVALRGENYPVKTFETENVWTGYVRIEGKDNTIWRGCVTVGPSTVTADSGNTYHTDKPTALGALDAASKSGGFTYSVTDQWGQTYEALFVNSVAGEEASGAYGWMYRVISENDWISPMVGAGGFELNVTTPPNPPHTEVLWYWGTWDAHPMRISVSKTEVMQYEYFTVTAEYFSDENSCWYPVDGAVVYADGTHKGYTSSDGTAEIKIENPGTYSVYVEKEGYVRSDKRWVTVLQGPSGTVQGQTVVTGVVPEPFIEISVPPSLSIDLIKGTTNYVDNWVEVDSNAPWDLCVSDPKGVNRGYMTDGDGKKLVNPMEIYGGDMSAPESLENPVELASGEGPRNIWFQLIQYVEYRDTAGEYEIVLEFTATPRF